MDIDWTEPKITDWISSIGTLLGIPTVIYGIFRLFVKNKDQEKKLNALESLAQSQALQIQELARQTSEYQYHSELMRESNEIFKDQVNIQNQVFLHNRVTDKQIIELQKKERRLSIKPHFVSAGMFSNVDKFDIHLKNKGKTAKNLRLEQIGEELARIRKLDSTKEYDQNQKLEFSGRSDSTRTELNSKQVPFNIIIHFEDIDGNRYEQRLTRQQHKIDISEPKLIENQSSESGEDQSSER
ncbi:MAG: hypothetical protein ACFB15_27715 [Cyclobacteriaceae bacterium]